MCKLQKLANIAQIGATLVSIFALAGVYFQVEQANHSSQLATATNLYDNYLQLAMDSSEFSDGYFVKEPNEDTYRKYTWYISRLLFSAESILALDFKDDVTEKEWKTTLVGQLSYHKDYLSSCDFSQQRRFHSERLIQLIDEKILPII